MKEVIVYEAPENTLSSMKYSKRIFLAGTIDMGGSTDWQAATIKMIAKLNAHSPSCVFNPRRKSWDSTWAQSIDNVYFNQQVNWELVNLEKATHIIMHFAGDSKSPISLLELGLFAKSSKLHVVCHPDFYRKGNVEVVCDNYKIPMYDSLEEVVSKIML
jgi:hypothetical protein